MQTLPAFVHLVPVIALFGIGKPSGIIATVIFGTAPMVCLTRSAFAAFRRRSARPPSRSERRDAS